jgi:hypothetical protein
MKFLFSEPFTRVAGKGLEFSLAHPVLLRELIGRLPSDLVKMFHHDDAISMGFPIPKRARSKTVRVWEKGCRTKIGGAAGRPIGAPSAD